MKAVTDVVKDKEVQDILKNLLEDSLNALMGNPVSAGKVISNLAKAPFLLSEKLFWTKIDAFINGVYLPEEDRLKLCAKLTEKGEHRDNAFRLLSYIEKAENMRKIDYLINATRCFLSDFIDRSEYFRICHAIVHTLEEDLIFLSERIFDKDISANLHTQGLLTSGLMYQSVIDTNGDNNGYSFTEFAHVVDEYAVSYKNLKKYPNPKVRYKFPKYSSVQETRVVTEESFVTKFEEALEKNDES